MTGKALLAKGGLEKAESVLAICMPGRYNWRVSAAGVAQLVEHLICNQWVGGSNPFASSSLSDDRCGRIGRRELEDGGAGS